MNDENIKRRIKHLKKFGLDEDGRPEVWLFLTDGSAEEIADAIAENVTAEKWRNIVAAIDNIKTNRSTS
jgi:hypothetical protein